MRIVVIGAGVAGLTVGALLAQAGDQVTVLEAHVDPGGCAATYFHRGYRFDAGATLVGGFQPGGPHALAGERLGLQWPVHPAEPAMVVHSPDAPGGSVVRWGDPDRWQAERLRAFGSAAERFWRSQEFVADQVWRFAATLPPWPPHSPADLLRLARRAASRPALGALAPLLPATVGQWARALGAGRANRAFWTFLDAQLLISAQAGAAQVAALFGAVALDLARVGVYHVRGGVGGIAETLAAAVQRQGGRIIYKAEATRIEVRNSRVVGVHTRVRTRGGYESRFYEADLIVANLTPWDVVRLLGDQAPAALRRQVGRLPDEWGAFTLALGVDAAAIPTGFPDHHQVVQDPSLPLGEGNSVFISLSPEWDESRAPAGQRAVTLSTHTRTAPWWALRHKPGGQPAYEERVARYTETLLRAAEQVLPGLRRAIHVSLPGTPVTFERFTRRARGFVGGFPQTSLQTALSPRLPVEGLWLVGDSIFPGQSTAGVTLGALRVADSILLEREPARRRRPPRADLTRSTGQTEGSYVTRSSQPF